MKTFIKCLVLPAMAFMSLSSMAATPGVTFLFSNGQKASFAFDSKPKIAVTTDGLSVSSTDTSAVSYAFADVQKFYFEDDINTAISQVEEPINHPIFTYKDNIVNINGMTVGERVTIVTSNGSLVTTLKANNTGNASVDLSNIPAGMYIVSINNSINFKILKK